MKLIIQKHSLLIGLFFLFASTQIIGQVIPFNTENWEINARGHLFDNYKGNQAIYLKNGIAWLKEVEFQNGIIEFDVYMEERRSFSGIIFRVEDRSNYEEIYLRGHLNGMPDAMQYTPVNNGQSAWQLYHDQGRAVLDGQIGWQVEHKGGYNALFHYPFGRWFHLKLIVSGTRADLYLDNQENPILQIRELKRGITKGGIGIKSSRGAVYFANFSYQKKEEVTLTELPDIDANSLPKNIIPSWQISTTFSEENIANKQKLSAALLTDKKWTTLKAEATGLTNIAILYERNRKINTVFAKVIIQSDSDQVKRLDFGYSDRVQVYCNQQIIYSGNNGYRSRDYRYLGSIGYFDSTYLPLKKGRNELILAVSEGFGGWGLQGKLENFDGIRVIESE